MSAWTEAEEAGAAPLTELLLVRQGVEYFALVLTAAMEALELPALTPIPEAPACLLGMLADRGAGIPVFAGSRILEVEGLRTGAEVLVIVRDGERQVGLVVDEVEDVIMVDVATMQQPMDAMRGGGIVRGVVRSEHRLIAVLDARALVRLGARALPEIA
jgi:purine-binding chemotaxis protein CheW